VAGVWLATEFDTTFVVESGRPAEIFSFLAAIQAIKGFLIGPSFFFTAVVDKTADRAQVTRSGRRVKLR